MNRCRKQWSYPQGSMWVSSKVKKKKKTEFILLETLQLTILKLAQITQREECLIHWQFTQNWIYSNWILLHKTCHHAHSISSNVCVLGSTLSAFPDGKELMARNLQILSLELGQCQKRETPLCLQLETTETMSGGLSGSWTPFTNIVAKRWPSLGAPLQGHGGKGWWKASPEHLERW